MAHQVGQEHKGNNEYRIQIQPEVMGPSSGKVLDAKGKEIKPWTTVGAGDVWVDVGSHKEGSLTEGGDGNAKRPWKIVHI